MIPSIYINLEDDVSKIVTRIKKERASELILVCPKRCFLFNDNINLRLLKKQADMLVKKIFILTMDERGQGYAKEAGFELRQFPKSGGVKGFSDISKKTHLTQPQILKTASKFSEDHTRAQPGVMDVVEEKIQPIKNFFKTENTEIQAESQETQILNKPEIEKKQNFFPSELETLYKNKKSSQKISRLVVGFVFCATVVILLVIFVILPKAEIIIYPKTQNLTRDFLKISASAQVKEPIAQDLVLPAVKISQTFTGNLTFQSQGKKEVGNKASGNAVVYNFSGAPITLKAKTTLFVLNNKNYLLKADALLIKPTKYKNAKTREVDESSLTSPLELEAAEGGEGYNVPAGTRLEITNQVFGSKPQVLYAKASTAITGGTSRYLSFISPEDILDAKNKLQTQIAASLATQIKEKNLVLQEKAVSFQNPQFTFDHEVGTETPEFSGRITAEVVGLAYSQNDLEQVVINRVKQSLETDGKINIKLTEPLAVTVKSVDFTNQLIVLDAHFEGIAVAINPSLEGLPSKLVGKSQTSAAELIKSSYLVDKVEITQVPNFPKWLPWLRNNIHIQIRD